MCFIRIKAPKITKSNYRELIGSNYCSFYFGNFIGLNCINCIQITSLRVTWICLGPVGLGRYGHSQFIWIMSGSNKRKRDEPGSNRYCISDTESDERYIPNIHVFNCYAL